MKNLEQQDYLNEYFISRIELEQTLGVDNNELTELIRCGVIPSWSYKIEYGILYSHVFKFIQVSNCRDDEYFSPYVIDWYYHNLTLFPDYKATENIKKKLRSQFLDAYMEEVNANESFKKAFPEIIENPESFQRRANDTWLHHLLGTFGVCVKKPSCIRQIIKKQVAVSVLCKVTNDGERSEYTDNELIELYKWFDAYDKVAMPFSPADYDKSSRKRLVDNVKDKIINVNFAQSVPI